MVYALIERDGMDIEVIDDLYGQSEKEKETESESKVLGAV